MSLSLGERLRAAREERGISISEVAEQTRISSLYLQSIENDNYKPLPGGIFNKGFVKSYARYVGVDEHEALNEYSKIVAQNEGTEDSDLRTYKPEVLTDDHSTPSMIPTILFAGIILALMTGGILFLVNYILTQPSPPTVATNTTANQNAVSTSNSVSPSSAAPSMQNLKVEFRSTIEPISLSATSDGKTSVTTVAPGGSAAFEPNENLKLSYSKSLAPSAQLSINGKPISLPNAPANPKRAAIEIEINKENIGQIWESGQFRFAVPQPVAEQTATPVQPATPRPASPTPATANTASANVGTTQTPIIVGRPPQNSTTPRPSPN